MDDDDLPAAPDDDTNLGDTQAAPASAAPTRTFAPRTRSGMKVHPVLEVLAAYGWRLAVLAGVAIGALWLLGQLWVLVFTLVIATYLGRVLDTPNRWLRDRGLPPAAAALAALVMLLGSLALLGWFLVPRIATQFDALGPTLSEATEDLEDWLLNDAPIDLTREDLEEAQTAAADAAREAARSSEGGLVSGALIVVELFTGMILSIITAFFMLKDGPRFQRWVVGRMPAPRRRLTVRLGRRAWGTLGGYLKGVVILGTLEGAVLGVTIALVGGELAWPVAIITFLGAFVPIVGAVAASVIAVLVALATAGTGAALVVAIVALAVQQLDNDLLAPVIYGRSLQLHPLTILFAVVAGGALFGIGGTILAVPLVAVVLNVVSEARRPATPNGDLLPEDDADDDEDDPFEVVSDLDLDPGTATA